MEEQKLEGVKEWARDIVLAGLEKIVGVKLADLGDALVTFDLTRAGGYVNTILGNIGFADIGKVIGDLLIAFGSKDVATILTAVAAIATLIAGILKARALKVG